MSLTTNRRGFLATEAASLGLGTVGVVSPALADRRGAGGLSFALVRAGIRGQGIVTEAAYFARCATIHDVDVAQLRHLTACHAANLKLRRRRALTFDPTTQSFVDDEQANAMLSRKPRAGLEISVQTHPLSPHGASR